MVQSGMPAIKSKEYNGRVILHQSAIYSEIMDPFLKLSPFHLLSPMMRPCQRGAQWARWATFAWLCVVVSWAPWSTTNVATPWSTVEGAYDT